MNTIFNIEISTRFKAYPDALSKVKCKRYRLPQAVAAAQRSALYKRSNLHVYGVLGAGAPNKRSHHHTNIAMRVGVMVASFGRARNPACEINRNVPIKIVIRRNSNLKHGNEPLDKPRFISNRTTLKTCVESTSQHGKIQVFRSNLIQVPRVAC